MARGLTVAACALGLLGPGNARADVAASPRRAPRPAVTSAQVEGLTVKVTSIRSWLYFDGRTPAIKGSEHWVSGVMKLQTNPAVGSSRLSAGTRQMSQGSDGYKAEFVSFAARDAPRPAGQLCELIVLIGNTGP